MNQMEPNERLRDLASRFSQVFIVLNPTNLREEVELLERQATDQGLWDDQENAQRVTSELSNKRQLLTRLVEIERLLEDTAVLLTLASQEDDSAAAAEVDVDIAKLGALCSERQYN